MGWKYILFDLDGTLTDSSDGILNCVIYALQAAGVEIPTRDTLLQFIGPPLMEGFQDITGMDHDAAAEATIKYRERYGVIGLFENKPYDGIALALSRLKSQGKILALATSKPETYAVRILQHFNMKKYFDVTVGSTMDGSRNNKTSVIKEALHRLGISKEDLKDVLMVGDRRHDIVGARECGIASLGVYYGFAEIGELEKAGADYIAWSIEDVVNIAGSGEEPQQPVSYKPEKLSDMKYERADLKKAVKELKRLSELQKDAVSTAEQLKLHQNYYHINDRVVTMAVLAYFRHSVNTRDEYYDKENAYYDENMPEYDLWNMKYHEVLYHSPYRKELEKVFGRVTFKNIELRIKSASPELVEMQQEENRLVSEYEKLLASAEFEWDGKKLSMSELERYQKDADRNIRHRAWNELQEFFSANGQRLDELYDALVKNRDGQAKKLGYKNYVELGYHRMRRNCYSSEDVAKFREAIKKYWLPLAFKLQEKRRQRIGVEKLHIEDNNLYYKEGNPCPQGTPEQILQNGLKMYEELSPETAVFMKKMIEQEMFDVLSRPGKQQGGYMEFLPEPRMPLIFANFNGTSGDVDVITHECGHAFQGYLAGQDDVREHWDITMETAETHSMSMEFFTDPWMELFFGEDASGFRRMQLEDAVCFIPYGCMVDEFQQIIYEYPELTPKQRHEVWRRLEKQYRPYLDPGDMEYFKKGGFWQKQHHIYSLPFYYIDYCLAQVCALQYKVMMEDDYQRAWQSYLKLCKMSATGYFTEMIQQVGLKNPLKEECIAELAQQLEEYIYHGKE